MENSIPTTSRPSNMETSQSVSLIDEMRKSISNSEGSSRSAPKKSIAYLTHDIGAIPSASRKSPKSPTRSPETTQDRKQRADHLRSKSRWQDTNSRREVPRAHEKVCVTKINIEGKPIVEYVPQVLNMPNRHHQGSASLMDRVLERCHRAGETLSSFWY